MTVNTVPAVNDNNEIFRSTGGGEVPGSYSRICKRIQFSDINEYSYTSKHKYLNDRSVEHAVVDVKACKVEAPFSPGEEPKDSPVSPEILPSN